MRALIIGLCGVLWCQLALADKPCLLDRLDAFAGKGRKIFDGYILSDPGRESFHDYVAKVKSQKKVLRSLIVFSLSQGTGAAESLRMRDLLNQIDGNGRDLKVVKRKLNKYPGRHVYEIEWGASDTSMGNIVELLGRIDDVPGKPYLFRLLAKHREGDRYFCDSSLWEYESDEGGAYK